ncbi:MAG: Diaminopimelate epimerase (EC [uncultured Thiotrichaceae bacterium]|uniref:Diaminopimelate epimerase n=1 Tax=uncultured Thiotrichaceae bacterium TaxID=298394 RepID=A0A6S6SPD6_9GAMM|nr:MAG: Diaminopimelate epimerase (EC [uncultured Thiotrichaceae bacterium]
MQLPFTKMHGLGNDFVMLDGVSRSIELSTEQVRFLADRHFGIGCDQLLLVENYDGDEADFRYRIFNADGSEVEQCGNGARCFANFVRDQQLTDKTTIPVMTAGGRIILNIEADNQVKVDMGVPCFEPEVIPFISEQRQTLYTVEVGRQTIELAVVSMGNPHGVITVDNVDDAPVATLGPALEWHPAFPQRANIGFMQIVSSEYIRLRVFERGGVETLACGSGACAAMVAGRIQGVLSERVEVELPGGNLHLVWQGEGYPVYMTGPATTVFSGTIEL